MKLSLTPPQVKIKLTKIIDNSKPFHRSQNTSFHPLPFKTSSKHSFNHLPSSEFLAGKQFSSIDHHLYKRIITGQDPTKQLQKPCPDFQQNQNILNFQQSINCHPKKYAFFRRSQPFQETTNTSKQRNYAGRLTTKEYYRNIDIMNRSSPLDVWKQLSKSYSKMQKQSERESFHTNEIKQGKRLDDKSLELLINCHKQNLPDNLYKAEQNLQVLDLIKKWKERQEGRKRMKRQKCTRREGELEDNIVLKKSFSCKISFQEFQSHHYNIGNFLTEQNNAELAGVKKQLSKKYEKRESLPTEASDQNPIVLLHKQPLEECMQVFFEPTEQMTSAKKKPKPLELMRIKSKKLSSRNVDCLERLKKNLFKDKTRRDLFAKQGSKSPKSGENQDEEIDFTQKSQNGQHEQIREKTLQQQRRSSPRNSNKSFCKFLKTEHRKSTQIANRGVDEQKKEFKPNEGSQMNEQRSNSERQQQERQIQKQSLKSSRISFSEVPTPQLPRTSLKGQSLINAW